jgi:hypothetical protein
MSPSNRIQISGESHQKEKDIKFELSYKLKKLKEKLKNNQILLINI